MTVGKMSGFCYKLANYKMLQLRSHNSMATIVTYFMYKIIGSLKFAFYFISQFNLVEKDQHIN